MRYISRLIIFLWIFFGVTMLWAEGNVSTPEQVVSEVSKTVLDVFKRERAMLFKNPQKAFDLAEKYVLPNVDMARMSGWVLGPTWKTATPAQRQAFSKAFQELLIRTYSTAFLAQLESGDTNLILLPGRGAPNSQDKQAEVRTEARSGNRPPVPISFRLYRHPQENRWKIFDVAIEGISLVTSYRSSFSEKIQQIGIDGLTAELIRRHQEARSGASIK